MTPETVERTLVPLAAAVIGCVHDYDPQDTGAVLNHEGIHDPKARALIVALAAMVNPDASPQELLAWTTSGPVKSREMTPQHLFVKVVGKGESGRQPERRAEVARLSAAGLSVRQIADRIGITPRSVVRHRKALREALGNPARVAS